MNYEKWEKWESGKFYMFANKSAEDFFRRKRCTENVYHVLVKGFYVTKTYGIANVCVVSIMTPDGKEYTPRDFSDNAIVFLNDLDAKFFKSTECITHDEDECEETANIHDANFRAKMAIYFELVGNQVVQPLNLGKFTNIDAFEARIDELLTGTRNLAQDKIDEKQIIVNKINSVLAQK